MKYELTHLHTDLSLKTRVNDTNFWNLDFMKFNFETSVITGE